MYVCAWHRVSYFPALWGGQTAVSISRWWIHKAREAVVPEHLETKHAWMMMEMAVDYFGQSCGS